MKVNSDFQSNPEVLNAKKMSEITGGKKIVIYIDGKRIGIEVPDQLKI